MKPVVFHAEAEWELREAIGYYERQKAGLGRDLREKVEATVGRIQEILRAGLSGRTDISLGLC